MDAGEVPTMSTMWDKWFIIPIPDDLLILTF